MIILPKQKGNQAATAQARQALLQEIAGYAISGSEKILHTTLDKKACKQLVDTLIAEGNRMDSMHIARPYAHAFFQQAEAGQLEETVHMLNTLRTVTNVDFRACLTNRLHGRQATYITAQTGLSVIAFYNRKCSPY